MIAKDARAYSSDSQQVLEMARLYTRTLRRHGIKVAAKHYLTLGTLEDGDVHDASLTVPLDDAALGDALSLYRELRSEIDAILVGHACNPLDNGLPYSISPATGTQIADEVGFQGVLIADEVRMTSLRGYVSSMPLSPRHQYLLAGVHSLAAKCAVLSFDAGLNIVMVSTAGAELPGVLDALEAAYAKDETLRAKLDKSMRRYREFATPAAADLLTAATAGPVVAPTV
jgi:beta-glucosidase-like glycosyl hydrolase